MDEVEAEPAMEAVEDEAEAEPALETIEVVAESAADETTNVVIDDASLSVDAAGFGEQTSEIANDPAIDPTNDSASDPASDSADDSASGPAGELSVADDTVTGSSSEADNSDAEPSR